MLCVAQDTMFKLHVLLDIGETWGCWYKASHCYFSVRLPTRIQLDYYELPDSSHFWIAVRANKLEAPTARSLSIYVFPTQSVITARVQADRSVWECLLILITRKCKPFANGRCFLLAYRGSLWSAGSETLILKITSEAWTKFIYILRTQGKVANKESYLV